MNSLQREADGQAQCYAGADIHEGIRAIREKRAAKYK